VDEDEDQDPTQAPPAPEWPTERVRIVGAEPAAVLAGEERPPAPAEPAGDDPADREQHYLGFVHHPTPPPLPLSPPPLDAGDLAAVPPELPHWSDPPTGQVPAAIDRRGEEADDEWGADSGPVWREHDHEWDSDSFQPAMLADDAAPLGALDERPPEARPWEFDDLGPAAEEAEPVPGSPGAEPRAETSGTTPSGPGAEEPSAQLSWGRRQAGFLSDADEDVSDADEDVLLAGGEPTRLFETAAPGAEAQAEAEPDAGGAPDAGRAAGPGGGAGGSASPHAGGAPDAGRAPGGVGPLPAGARRRSAPGPARAPDRPPARNVPVAIGTGVLAMAVVLGCLALGPLVSVVLATVVITLAAAETYAALRRAGLHPATLLGLVATVAVMAGAYGKGVAALPLVTALLVITAMLWYLVGAERGSPVVGISSTLLGFAWVGILGSFAALLLAPSMYPQRHGVAFALGAVVATVAADVGALAAGSWLGRHQLAPHVSPNKTWEGLVGGAVLAVVASALITGHVHPWTPAKAAVLGVVVAVVAPLGDLCESLVKRDLGLKDMGSLLPGHGGVLDRVDALLFVLPATYYLVRVLHLG
jgi:CDP-diglyceride synthetase